MKLFTTKQIAEIDRYTIENEPIADIDLMERAAKRISFAIRSRLSHYQEIVFFAGPGNNGGDAMAIARILSGDGYTCTVYLPDNGKPLTGSPSINWQRLKDQGKADLKNISREIDFPDLNSGMLVVDGLFGSGLSRPLEGLPASLVRHINNSHCDVFAIDLPSGLMGEDNSSNNPDNIIRARTTFTLQFPKISLLFPENEQYSGEVVVVDIKLHPDAISGMETPFSMTDKTMVADSLPLRARFSHKGSYGHALLIAGSYGKMGAALLASRACLRSGTGLVTTHLPACGYGIQQCGTPEVMCSIDDNDQYFTGLPPLEKYSAIGAGPGLGTHPDTQKAFLQLLESAGVPMVLDADVLNILSVNPGWLSKLPGDTILTPHPGEFRRLFGETENSWKRLELQRKISLEFKIIIVLKGASTSVSLADGTVFFNPSGNPGMATAGSGDVLTGIILGLLAQGVTPGYAAISGVFIHGCAGDHASRRFSEPAMIASDIIRCLGQVFKQLNCLREQEF